MLPISERIDRYEVHAFAAVDTIEPLMERIRAMVGTGRRMTYLRRYISDTTNAPEIHTGLTLHTDTPSGGFSVTRQRDGLGFSVLLHQNGRNYQQVGLSAYRHEGTEAEVAKRWHAKDFRGYETARVMITGSTGGVGFRDQIEITRFNENGVGIQTVLAFDTLDVNERLEPEAAVLDTLAATEATWTPEALRERAEQMRYHWWTLAESLSNTQAH